MQLCFFWLGEFCKGSMKFQGLFEYMVFQDVDLNTILVLNLYTVCMDFLIWRLCSLHSMLLIWDTFVFLQLRNAPNLLHHERVLLSRFSSDAQSSKNKNHGTRLMFIFYKLYFMIFLFYFFICSWLFEIDKWMLYVLLAYFRSGFSNMFNLP